MEGRARITTKGRRKSKRITEGIKKCPELTPYCSVWARPFQEYMEFWENWLPELSWPRHSSCSNERKVWEKRRRGTEIPFAFLQLCLSWEGLYSQSLQPEPCFHGNPLAACKAVTTHSGSSVAEPENGIGEVWFPALLILNIFTERYVGICVFSSECHFSSLTLNMNALGRF